MRPLALDRSGRGNDFRDFAFEQGFGLGMVSVRKQKRLSVHDVLHNPWTI
jgi:hypothetical protein